jgi:superfamily II DNA or RNA helicase
LEKVPSRGVIEVRPVDEVRVRINARDEVLLELQEHFTFEVPGYKFSPAYRNGWWDGKIRLFDFGRDVLYKGLIERVKEFADGNDYTVDLSPSLQDVQVDEAKVVEALEELELPFEPDKHQMKAVMHCLRKGRAVVVSPTGSGKSFIIYLLTRLYNLKTLVIVPSVGLVSQMASDFEDYGYPRTPHKIMAGADKDPTDQVTVSTWQSIVDMPRSWFDQFDVVFGDEVHEFKAKSLIKIMEKTVGVQFKFGLTGTLDDVQTNKLTLEGLFGKAVQFVTTKQLMEEGRLAKLKVKVIVLRHPEEVRKAWWRKDKDGNGKTYDDEVTYLIGLNGRNRFLTKLSLSLKGNTLVMFRRVAEHGLVMLPMFREKAKDRKVHYIAGDVDVKDREAIRKVLETEDDSVLLASLGTTARGVNVKRLSNLVAASPNKSKIKVLQSLGRILRTSEHKDVATLYDVADDLRWKKSTNYTYEHLKERLKIYAREGFDVELFEIDLPPEKVP